MASDILIYDSIAASNIPKREKSLIQSWVDSVSNITSGPPRQYHKPAGHLEGFIGTLRQYSEGAAVGAVLGVVHAELKNGLDIAGAPVDGLAGFVAGSLSLLMSGEAATSLTNIGSHSSCVYSFRQMHKLRAEMLRAKGRVPGGTVSGTSTKPSTMAGEDANDPIVQAAMKLGKTAVR
jgi:hypothetical protein